MKGDGIYGDNAGNSYLWKYENAKWFKLYDGEWESYDPELKEYALVKVGDLSWLIK